MLERKDLMCRTDAYGAFVKAEVSYMLTKGPQSFVFPVVVSVSDLPIGVDVTNDVIAEAADKIAVQKHDAWIAEHDQDIQITGMGKVVVG